MALKLPKVLVPGIEFPLVYVGLKLGVDIK